MPNAKLSKTAQVNLLMLADLGIPEAVRFRDVLQFDSNPLQMLEHIPFASNIPLCISTVSEILYQRANDLIIEQHNPTVLDLACGFSPRVMVMSPRGYTYIGADLPEVAELMAQKRKELIPNDPTLFAGYRCIDVTNREQMEKAVGGLREKITIVTQGLLTYLTPVQKQELMDGVKSLLARDGGCWIIPDANPDRMLDTSFKAILGRRGAGVVKAIYKILDKDVNRSRAANGWQNIDEISAALEEFGFAVRRVPLYRDGLIMWCMGEMEPDAAKRLVSAWKEMSALVVTLPE
ncbi:MAG: hypothetical protein J6D34_00365 [Atopobiaceae bacterium]|nr:hypothetical protein [Atopobiaceae bacterium]